MSFASKVGGCYLPNHRVSHTFFFAHHSPCIFIFSFSLSILHDNSPSNVLLHFDKQKNGRVYIGICDWGLSSRVVEGELSKYGYESVEKMDEVKFIQRFASPELFFVYIPLGSRNSYEIKCKKPLYSMAADTFAVGWIAYKIWEDDYNEAYFGRNHKQFLYLLTKLESLKKEHSKEWNKCLTFLLYSLH